jgi:hypothetical protein
LRLPAAVGAAARSPQSNGRAPLFDETFKRNYMNIRPTPDALTVLQQLPIGVADYNEVRPNRALLWRHTLDSEQARSVYRLLKSVLHCLFLPLIPIRDLDRRLETAYIAPS